jgi:hypothetical protein
MYSNFGKFSLTTLVAILSACASSPPPSARPGPAQVQVNFDFTPRDDSASPKHFTRGAIAGTPQQVGFYYSVNPDCSSDGLVQLQLKDPPKHGAVTFNNADGYSNFPVSSPGHDCNKKKSPGVKVVYTSAKDFVGTDQFTVQGIGPHGKYMESEYAVKVVAPSG